MPFPDALTEETVSSPSLTIEDEIETDPSSTLEESIEETTFCEQVLVALQVTNELIALQAGLLAVLVAFYVFSFVHRLISHILMKF